MKAIKHVLLAVTAFAVSATVAHASTTTIGVVPSSVTVTYTKGTGPGSTQNVVVKPAAGTIYFTVDTAIPNWLLVSPTNGSPTSTTGTTVGFTASPYAANLGAGVYTGTVTLHANTGANTAPDQTIAVTLDVRNAAPTIVAPAPVLITTWKAGDTLPTASITAQSSGDPVTFTVTPTYTSPTSAWFTVSAPSLVAYSWGTTLTFNFVQSAFDNVTIGKNLTGSVKLTPSNGTAPVTVNVTVQVGGPTATVSSVKPPKFPVVSSGTNARTVAIAGTNFADGMNVHINSAAALTNNCTTFAAAKVNALCIQSSTLMYVKLTEATDLKNAGTITINVGAANGQVTVTASPIVYSVTNSASFVQTGGNPVVSPFEIISIFGENFSSSVVYGTVTGGRYAASLTDGATNPIKVHFYKADGTTPLDSDPDAYLLLATPNQINLMVPSTLPSPGAAAAQMVIDYNSVLSDPVVLDVAAAHPGFFTTDNGMNQVVAVHPDFSTNSSSNPAVQGANSFLTFYLAGLGRPDGTGAVGDTGPSKTCLSVANYFAAANTANSTTWATADGEVIDPTLLGTFNLPPCITSAPTVTIGGVDFTSRVTYAGWVQGSVAGLYQMNVSLPLTSLTGAVKASGAGIPAGANASNPYYIKVAVGSASSPDNTVYVYLK